MICNVFIHVVGPTCHNVAYMWCDRINGYMISKISPYTWFKPISYIFITTTWTSVEAPLIQLVPWHLYLSQIYYFWLPYFTHIAWRNQQLWYWNPMFHKLFQFCEYFLCCKVWSNKNRQFGIEISWSFSYPKTYFFLPWNKNLSSDPPCIHNQVL